MFDDLAMDAEKWEGSLCSNPKYNPDLWFDFATITEAKEICRRCPLVLMCAAYAIENDEHDGVWGGLSPEDRRQLRLQRGRRMWAVD